LSANRSSFSFIFGGWWPELAQRVF
jgi:hypothetical protein